MATTRRLDAWALVLVAMLLVISGGDAFANLRFHTCDAVSIGMGDSIRRLPFNASEFPKKIKFKGQIVGGAAWEDAQGIHQLVISSVEKGSFGDRGYQSMLFAQAYVEHDGHLKRVWKQKSQASNCLESLAIDSSATAITDMDRDGIAESLYGFLITPDGEDPERAQLVLHLGRDAFVVTGQFAGSEDDRGKVEQMVMDPATETLSTVFKDYLKGAWEKLERRYYDSWQ